MIHHRLDPYPVPKDKTPLYINEPWLIDPSISENLSDAAREPELQEDNIRLSDGCSEVFPFEMIDSLKGEYL